MLDVPDTLVVLPAGIPVRVITVSPGLMRSTGVLYAENTREWWLG
jgi:hypothetical protein